MSYFWQKVINLSSNFIDSKSVFAKIYVLWLIICNKIVEFFYIFLLRGIFSLKQQELTKKVRLVRYIEQNFAKIIHDVALAIEKHNAMSTPILAVLL